MFNYVPATILGGMNVHSPANLIFIRVPGL